MKGVINTLCTKRNHLTIKMLYRKEDLLKLVLFLRFGTTNPTTTAQPCLGITGIARLLKSTQYRIKTLISQA